MRSLIRIAMTAIVLQAPAACAYLTDVGTSPDASVEVDPTPIRTIHYYAVGGEEHDPPSEVTTKSREEIDCLHTSPRQCWVSEAIRATIHNTGSSTVVYHPACDRPLERNGLGDWHKMGSPACLSIAVPPVEIGPGTSYPSGDEPTGNIGVSRMPPAQYRVRFSLIDEQGELLLDDMRTSAPFDFEPLPDYEPWVCPTETRVDKAKEIAERELENAMRGDSERGAESVILRLENEVPGVGGLYYDPDENRWVISVKDEARRAAAAAALRGYLDGDAAATPNSDHPVHVTRADFAFSELVGWSEVLVGYLGSIPGWYSIDADEKLNRVSVGLAHELDRADIECLVRGIGMPEEMLHVEVRG